MVKIEGKINDIKQIHVLLKSIRYLIIMNERYINVFDEKLWNHDEVNVDEKNYYNAALNLISENEDHEPNSLMHAKKEMIGQNGKYDCDNIIFPRKMKSLNIYKVSTHEDVSK